jgi:hypothetical protein
MNADPVFVSEFVESKPRTSVTLAPAGPKGDGGLRAEPENAHTGFASHYHYHVSCTVHPVSCIPRVRVFEV